MLKYIQLGILFGGAAGHSVPADQIHEGSKRAKQKTCFARVFDTVDPVTGEVEEKTNPKEKFQFFDL